MNQFLGFVNEANKTPELLVYGDIGEWMDVDSREFARSLQAIDSDQIHVKINSLGGSVFTAQAIVSMLKRHKATVTVYIDGIAASAASMIAMAGDKIIMPNNAMMMIHNPLTIAWGNAEEMRETADLLDKIREPMINLYKDKTGLDAEKIIELLDAETWMTAHEAVAYGFADEVESKLQVAACVKDGKLTINGLDIAEKYKQSMPKTFIENVKIEDVKPVQAEKPKPKESNPMTLDELKANHPDLYKQILDEGKSAGVQAERARIKAIEDMAMAGHEDLVNKAKFETGMTAEAVAVELIKAEKSKKDQYLNNRQADANDIPNDVHASAGEPPKPQGKQAKEKADEKAKEDAFFDGFSEIVNKGVK